MQLIEVTSIYAAVLGLMFVAVTLRVALLRMSKQLSAGDGGDRQFAKLIRGHGNFAETVPIALVLIALLELQGSSNFTLHVLGTALVIGRISHYIQLTGLVKPLIFRTGGMILTLGTIVSASVRLLLGT